MGAASATTPDTDHCNFMLQDELEQEVDADLEPHFLPAVLSYSEVFKFPIANYLEFWQHKLSCPILQLNTSITFLFFQCYSSDKNPVNMTTIKLIWMIILWK